MQKTVKNKLGLPRKEDFKSKTKPWSNRSVNEGFEVISQNYLDLFREKHRSMMIEVSIKNS